MTIAEITQKVKSLSRNDEEISKMLQEEESPANYFEQGVEYPVFTPLGQEKAAAQLQAFLDREKSSQKQSITI